MRITVVVAVACLGLGAISAAASETQAAFKQQTDNPAASAAPQSSSESAAQGQDRAKGNQSQKGTPRKSLRDRFRMAQADPRANSQSTTVAAQPTKLGEVIITAEKRATNLQTTAVAMSVISGNLIDQEQFVGMNSYLEGLPGVSYQDRGTAANNITIRGIGVGSQLSTNSPVGSYFGEVPMTGLGSQVNGNQAGNSDIKLVDIQNVEVLRGPQGTLYGSGAMGGLIRTIPNAPNLQAAGGHIAVGDSHTGDFGGNNYNASVVANVPVIQDQLAVRVVVFSFHDEGFIRNVAATDPTSQVTAAVKEGALAVDQDHIGNDVFNGVRVTTLWQPTSKFSASFMYMDQQLTQEGETMEQTQLPGPYLQSLVQVGEGGSSGEYSDQNLALWSLVLKYKLGWGSFTNAASLVDSDVSSNTELSFYGPPFVNESAPSLGDTKQFTDETRFVSTFPGPFQLIAGTFFENQDIGNRIFIVWNGYPPPPASAFYENIDTESVQKQLAAFGELSYTPFAPLKFTVGAREFKFISHFPLDLSLGVPSSTQGEGASVSKLQGKAGVSYKLTKHYFIYSLWSQGYRAPLFQTEPSVYKNPNGTTTFVNGTVAVVPTGLLNPDTVNNYEVGIKFQSDRLRSSLDAFRIYWKGIPISPSLTQILGAAFYFNAGEAISTGLEFESTAILNGGWVPSLSASYTDAYLSVPAPGLGGAGAQLPGSSKVNVKAALEKRFMIAGRDAFVRVDDTYVGKYYSEFNAPVSEAGDYDLINLTAGVSINKMKFGLYVKNLTNRDNFTWVDNVFAKQLAWRLTPRTIGADFSMDF
ncbi:MAG: TonB-dependent receptor [Steroidobacteraceae bacterium]